MARAGLGPGWRSLLACDIDAAKASAYRNNWGTDHFIVADVRDLRAADVEETPDLLWASSPCQDISQAGARGGLDGGRSGALWPALDLVRQLAEGGRAPRLVVVENVVGMATSRGGEDIVAVVAALGAAGYRVGALVIDAALFLPQSRPRLFVIGAAPDISPPRTLLAPAPVRTWHPAALAAAAARCARWAWWSPSPPPPRQLELGDVLEPEAGVHWQTEAQTRALLSLMSERDAARLANAQRGGRTIGTLTRRMRPAPDGGHVQRAELRLDGVAGCLRTPAGGSSQQTLVIADAGTVRTRPLTPRECARLMGLPDGYKLARKREDALRLLGEGVAVPVVRYLAAALLEPLLEAAALHVRPEPRGIKAATRATTLYLLPQELRRLRRLALDLDVSLHDLVLRGLDRVLADHGQRPLERYREPKSR